MTVSQNTIAYWIEYLRETATDNSPERDIADYLEALQENRFETRVINRAQYAYIKDAMIQQMLMHCFSEHDIYKLARIANVHTDVILELVREYEMDERENYGLPPGSYPKTDKLAKKIEEMKERRGCYTDGSFDYDAYDRNIDAEYEKFKAEGLITKTARQKHAELMQRVKDSESPY